MTELILDDVAICTRNAEITGTVEHEDQYQITAVLSTEKAVLRRDNDGNEYDEILVHRDGNVDLSRMPIPVFIGHEPIIRNRGALNIGLVNSVEVRDGQLIGQIQLGQNEQSRAIWPDVKNKIIRYLSLSYRVLADSVVDRSGDRPRLLARWMPYEASFVGLPEDSGAQVLNTRNLQEDNTMPDEPGITDNSQQELTLNAPSPEGDNELIENRSADVDMPVQVPELSYTEIRTRQAEVAGLFDLWPQLGALKSRCLQDMVTPDRAREMILDELGRQNDQPSADTRTVNISLGADSADKWRAGATEALQIRLGYQPCDRQNPYTGYTLVRMAEQCLVAQGVSIAGLNPAQIAIRSLSTGDFPIILENTMNKAMQEAFDPTMYTYSQVAKIGSVNDFRPHSRVLKGEQSLMEEVPEYGEYPKAQIGEERELLTAKVKGSRVIMSFQMIVNDDLQAFADQANDAAASAYETVESDLYASINANPQMNDGTAFYDATHNNLATAAALDVDSVSELRKLLSQQLGITGARYLRTLPAILLTHESNRDQANILMTSQGLPTATFSEGVTNPINGLAEPVSTPYLATETEYHLIGRQRGWEVAFLNGQQVPFVEQRINFDNDAREWKVRLVYAVGPINWRTHAKNPGA